MSRGVIRIGVDAVALRGPGLTDWESGQAVLRGAEAYRPAPIVLDAPGQLSAAERRRAVPSVRLALGVGAACVAQAGVDPGEMPAVFASSGADGETIAAILAALATPGREVSPTRFHNSVHNAASGYWGIATRSREAATSVSCFDASFAAGLLEAGVQAVTQGRRVLLVACDLPYPEPLARLRPIAAGLGVALVLAPSGGALGELRMAVVAEPGDSSRCADPGLEALRRGNPAARSLPLLATLAGGAGGRIRLELSRGSLDIAVVPAPDAGRAPC